MVEQIPTVDHRGPHATEGGCAPKEAAAHGKPTLEQVFPGGLKPMANACTGAGERWEREEAAEVNRCVLTITPSTHPVPSGEREESGLEPDKNGREGVDLMLDFVSHYLNLI